MLCACAERLTIFTFSLTHVHTKEWYRLVTDRHRFYHTPVSDEAGIYWTLLAELCLASILSIAVCYLRYDQQRTVVSYYSLNVWILLS